MLRMLLASTSLSLVLLIAGTAGAHASVTTAKSKTLTAGTVDQDAVMLAWGGDDDDDDDDDEDDPDDDDDDDDD
jgi:hypothetical protein